MGTFPKILNTLFSYNWNNKLHCKSFTTIRLWNPKKYAINSVHEIWLNKVQLGKAKVLSHHKLTNQTLNEWHARLDTGYSLAETLRILGRMYKKKNPEYIWVLFEMVERYENSNSI